MGFFFLVKFFYAHLELEPPTLGFQEPWTQFEDSGIDLLINWLRFYRV